MSPRNTALLLLFPIFLTACGGRSINKKTAQHLIASEALLDPGSLDVDSISQTTSGEAIVQTKLPAAFRLERERGRWVIREVKVGNNPWEKLENIVSALEGVKREDTGRLLDRVAAALDRYHEKNGRLPEFQDYVSLTDALSPDYLSPLVRLDSWGRPFVAVRISPLSIHLVSAGSDGKLGTPDDIVVTRTYR